MPVSAAPPAVTVTVTVAQPGSGTHWQPEAVAPPRPAASLHRTVTSSLAVQGTDILDNLSYGSRVRRMITTTGCAVATFDHFRVSGFIKFHMSTH